MARLGETALTRTPYSAHYAAAQRVSAITPSLAMHPHLVKVTTPELLAELTAKEAFGRYAEPWEVANVIVFLAGDYASYMT
ncbi:SDR family oxidoreductase, partial [Streptomyces beijiangensis]|uniref:SDR family oxidoreductase n=1 Tax=Streptomyces beijiangensis TaxID=163361 RepID=UPI0035578111